MKSNLTVLVVLTVLVGASMTQAAAPKSLVGTWKVESVKVNGKEINYGQGIYAKDGVWKVKKNGTASIGGFHNWTWSYDSDEGEFAFQRVAIFGWSEKYLWSVTSVGMGIKFKFQSCFSIWEVVLIPD